MLLDQGNAAGAAFGAALEGIDLSGTPEDVSDRINRAVSRLIGGDRAVRDCLGRGLVEASESSQRLSDALAELVEDGLTSLERAGLVRRGTDPVWRAYAVMFIILGPIMLNRQLEARLGADAFAPEVVAARSAANVDLLRHGLFTS